jgi:hypothetical protein
MGYVSSLRPEKRVEIFGFENADDSIHMIEWLRKGRDFRQFVVNDVEAELYAQDNEAQLLSISCNSKPECETKAKRQPGSDSKAILTQFSITFPLSLRVQASNNDVWQLDVMHNYRATNMDMPGKFDLMLSFTIVRHQIE